MGKDAESRALRQAWRQGRTDGGTFSYYKLYSDYDRSFLQYRIQRKLFD